MQADLPPTLPNWAAVVPVVGHLVRERSLLIVVGRWARITYRCLLSGYQYQYYTRYNIVSHNPRVFQLLGRVLAGLLVPSDWQALVTLNQEVQAALFEFLPDYAATRIVAFLGRGY